MQEVKIGRVQPDFSDPQGTLALRALSAGQTSLFGPFLKTPLPWRQTRHALLKNSDAGL